MNFAQNILNSNSSNHDPFPVMEKKLEVCDGLLFHIFMY